MNRGYVSSYDVQTASGFIRRDDDPSRLVRFRQSDLDRDADVVLEVGQAVLFEAAAPADEGDEAKWDLATSVEIPWNEVRDDQIEDVLDES